jgi:hypothetical protein
MGALTKFDISSNNIRAEGGKALAAVLKGNQVITEFNLGGNSLGYNSAGNGDTSGVIAIADAIPDMGALTSLNLASNAIGGYEDKRGYFVATPEGITTLCCAHPTYCFSYRCRHQVLLLSLMPSGI